MGGPNNAKDSSDRLPVVVIGVGGFGGLTLSALAKSERVRVVGVSDRDRAAAERAGKASGAPAFTDNRSLLAETRPAAAYLAVPPMEAPALVAACAARGVHVWKELPLARNLEEGLAMVAAAERAKVKLAVGTQRRFAAGYRRARDLLPKLGELFLARAHYLFHWGGNLAWRGDKASAGGGALIELGYHLVDLLVWMLGLPEDVYGTSAIVSDRKARSQGRKLQPIHDTDDTAAAILRYAAGPVATVVTTRCSGPASEEVSLHGRGGWLSASSETCLFRGQEGEIVDSLRDPASPLDVFRLQAEAFAQAVATDSPTYECSARENLLNLAVIEAIYLSGKTSQPESPARLLDNLGLKPNQCLIHRPAE